VPQAEVMRYAVDLESITAGRGAFSLSFSHYEEVPRESAAKVVEETKKLREEEKD